MSDERRVGLTGTRDGMTIQQYAAVTQVLAELGPAWLHHGDCVGADADAHSIAEQLGIKTHIHPPANTTYRAYCDGDAYEESASYLVRDRHLVDRTSVLIAAPNGFTDQGGGTWYTIRYARSQRKRVIIVFPNGTIREEP
jgi:hypothetical protein